MSFQICRRLEKRPVARVFAKRKEPYIWYSDRRKAWPANTSWSRWARRQTCANRILFHSGVVDRLSPWHVHCRPGDRRHCPAPNFWKGAGQIRRNGVHVHRRRLWPYGYLRFWVSCPIISARSCSVDDSMVPPLEQLKK